MRHARLKAQQDHRVNIESVPDRNPVRTHPIHPCGTVSLEIDPSPHKTCIGLGENLVSLRRNTEQTTGLRILDHPHCVIRSDLDIADPLTNFPAFGWLGPALTIEGDAEESLASQTADES